MKKHKYTVYIDDNFHFMDKLYRIKYAQCDTIEEVIFSAWDYAKEKAKILTN